MTTHLSRKNQFKSIEVEDLFYDAMLEYSLRHLMLIGNVTQESTSEALQKSLQICHLVGINTKHHFKQVYIFNATDNALHIDWRMSKTGFNLVIIQIPSTNNQVVSWVWKLAHNSSH